MKRTILFLVISFSLRMYGFAQDATTNSRQVIYKQIDTISLALDFYYPADIEPNRSYPVMIFFFGGGWNGGRISQFEPHAKYFSDRGIICVLADYRVKSRHNSTPFDALEDAKSAMRYLREHASEFQIDTSKIVASGGSAGGHLAAATAIISKYDNPSENLQISSKPNALVLFNPVIDNGPGGYGYDRIGVKYKDFSPLHNINEGAPPTIFFLGTEDKLIPVVTAEYYKTVMEKVRSRCDLIVYEGEGHGFFNYKFSDNYNKTISETEKFLTSLGYFD